jgi:hypothetical protein
MIWNFKRNGQLAEETIMKIQNRFDRNEERLKSLEETVRGRKEKPYEYMTDCEKLEEFRHPASTVNRIAVRPRLNKLEKRFNQLMEHLGIEIHYHPEREEVVRKKVKP